MPDSSFDFAATEARNQFAKGFIAGKKRARLEVILVLVALYFIIATIGKIAST